MERRTFLKHGAAAAAFSTIPGKVLGANDLLRVGFVGCGRVSNRHVKEFSVQPNVEIVAMCDVYEPNLNRRMKTASDCGCTNVQTYHDYRKLLERKDIDIIVNSTPDHWHALPTIEACQLGKDV